VEPIGTPPFPSYVDVWFDELPASVPVHEPSSAAADAAV